MPGDLATWTAQPSQPLQGQGPAKGTFAEPVASQSLESPPTALIDCEYCTQRFATRSLLYKHSKRMHFAQMETAKLKKQEDAAERAEAQAKEKAEKKQLRETQIQ